MFWMGDVPDPQDIRDLDIVTWLQNEMAKIQLKEIMFGNVDSPPDKIANVDVTTLTTQQAHDFRLELTRSIFYPEREGLTETDIIAYKEKIEEIKTFLGSD